MGEVREGEFLGGEECGGEGVEGLLFRWVGLGIALMGRGGGYLWGGVWIGELVLGQWSACEEGNVVRGGERIREVYG